MTLIGISNLPEDVYFRLLNTEDALAAAKYPLSTLYYDVGQFEKFGFFIFLGALDSALTAQIYQDTSATQTASHKVITGAVATCAADMDDRWYCIEVETRKLDISNGFHYVTLDVAGPTGNDYGCIVFYGIPFKMPATQLAAVTGEATTGTVIVAG
jgi:hypothetical protein